MEFNTKVQQQGVAFWEVKIGQDLHSELQGSGECCRAEGSRSAGT